MTSLKFKLNIMAEREVKTVQMYPEYTEYEKKENQNIFILQ